MQWSMPHRPAPYKPDCKFWRMGFRGRKMLRKWRRVDRPRGVEWDVLRYTAPPAWSLSARLQIYGRSRSK